MHKFQCTARAPAIVVSQDRIQHSMLAARPFLKGSSELSATLARCCHALIGIGVFRAAIDLLQLTGPLVVLTSADYVGDEVGGLILLSITIATEFLPVVFLVVLISGSSFYLPASAFSRPSLRRHLLP
jgi:hypothetical protein